MSKTDERIARVENYFSKTNGAVIAYSGGVNSTLVAYLAHKILKRRAIIVLADSPLLAPGEKYAALKTAKTCGLEVKVIPHPGYECPEMRNNTADRCYICKFALFEKLWEMADARNFEMVCCGDDADDLEENQPSRRAAQELEVSSPLAELGIDKNQIRTMARHLGLPNAELAPSSCLATRLPKDKTIDEAELLEVAAAEKHAREIFPQAKITARLD